jgi:predicted amidohydrolase
MARAAENGVYLIAANRYGLERGVQFSGGSALIDPDGSLQSVLDTGDGIVWGWIDPSRARDKRPDPGRPEDLIADRRPDAYGAMTLNAYLWDPREFHGLYGIRPLPEERRSRVAVVQFSPKQGDVAGNLDRVARETRALAETNLVVFPELVVTGPVADREVAERLAETIPGPSTERLREIAALADVYLIAGLIERDADSGLLYNSAVLVGPGGVVGTYRKLHLAAEDRPWATPGNLGLPTFDIPPGRVGMLIGYDALFPEAARSLALDGADIIACPSLLSWPPVLPYGETAVPMPSFVEAGPTDAHYHLWRERERENNAHVLFANGGAPWQGWSGCFAAVWETEPRQESLVHGNREATATLEIETRGMSRAKDLVRMRIPIWYDAMQAPSQTAAHIARERGARPGAWLAQVSEAASIGLG